MFPCEYKIGDELILTNSGAYTRSITIYQTSIVINVGIKGQLQGKRLLLCCNRNVRAGIMRTSTKLRRNIVTVNRINDPYKLEFLGNLHKTM